jgi:hypothetical protein
MRIAKLSLAAATPLLLLASCGTSGGLTGRSGPDEFAVARAAPLVIPPDFALTPPRPGEARPQTTDGRTQALDVLFGGPAPRSTAEQQVLREAGTANAAQGARSVAGDPGTSVVDKGSVTQTILAVPEGTGQEASVSTPR